MCSRKQFKQIDIGQEGSVDEPKILIQFDQIIAPQAVKLVANLFEALLNHILAWIQLVNAQCVQEKVKIIRETMVFKTGKTFIDNGQVNL